MRTDALLAFVPIGSPLTISGTGTALASTNTIDLLGQGTGTAPANVIGNTTVWGAPDAEGVGGPRPELAIFTGTAFTTSNSATLTIAFQGAVDAGTPTYQPGTWQTISQSPAMTAAQLTANTPVMRFPWLPPFPANMLPRFLRLLFTTATSTAFTAGTIGAALVTFVRDDQFNKYMTNNYVVS